MSAIDYTEAFFWTLTYIIIAFTGYINKDEKRIAIPPLTLWINFSWETASIIFSVREGLDVFSRAHFIRLSWFLFDIFILWFFLKKNKFFLRKIPMLLCYLSLFFVLTVFFFWSFGYSNYGMPITAFIIDALMEIFFWFYRKRLDPCNRLAIGITKILGDFFAGIYYGPTHPVVVVLACVAFFFDVLYIIYAIKERQLNPDADIAFKKVKDAFIKKLKVFLIGEKKTHIKRKYKKKVKHKKTHRKH